MGHVAQRSFSFSLLHGVPLMEKCSERRDVCAVGKERKVVILPCSSAVHSMTTIRHQPVKSDEVRMIVYATLEGEERFLHVGNTLGQQPIKHCLVRVTGANRFGIPAHPDSSFVPKHQTTDTQTILLDANKHV